MTAPVVRDGLDIPAFRAAVLAWYDENGRRLPFRGPTDPYLVLVSETILQQTQVARGGPAWAAFVERFPTVEALAAATPADVLRVWRGLGYNRRAINLQRAARIVVDQLGGAFPTDVAGLERLPGVGPYTARAVAAIAYGLPVGAVDTNVRRVLGRVAGGPAGDVPARDLQELADALARTDRAADWTHALMDLGSTVCLPRGPRCTACPVRAHCPVGVAGGLKGVPAAGDDRAGYGLAGDRRPVPGRRARQPAGRATLPFERTSRWLRGRIVDRLRTADGSSWVDFDGSLGKHDAAAVVTALRAMEREGLVELAPGDPLRARLPLG